MFSNLSNSSVITGTPTGTFDPPLLYTLVTPFAEEGTSLPPSGHYYTYESNGHSVSLGHSTDITRQVLELIPGLRTLMDGATTLYQSATQRIVLSNPELTTLVLEAMTLDTSINELVSDFTARNEEMRIQRLIDTTADEILGAPQATESIEQTHPPASFGRRLADATTAEDLQVLIQAYESSRTQAGSYALREQITIPQIIETLFSILRLPGPTISPLLPSFLGVFEQDLNSVTFEQDFLDQVGSSLEHLTPLHINQILNRLTLRAGHEMFRARSANTPESRAYLAHVAEETYGKFPGARAVAGGGYAIPEGDFTRHKLARAFNSLTPQNNFLLKFLLKILGPSGLNRLDQVGNTQIGNFLRRAFHHNNEDLLSLISNTFSNRLSDFPHVALDLLLTTDCIGPAVPLFQRLIALFGEYLTVELFNENAHRLSNIEPSVASNLLHLFMMNLERHNTPTTHRDVQQLKHLTGLTRNILRQVRESLRGTKPETLYNLMILFTKYDAFTVVDYMIVADAFRRSIHLDAFRSRINAQTSLRSKHLKNQSDALVLILLESMNGLEHLQSGSPQTKQARERVLSSRMAIFKELFKNLSPKLRKASPYYLSQLFLMTQQIDLFDFEFFLSFAEGGNRKKQISNLQSRLREVSDDVVISIAKEVRLQDKDLRFFIATFEERIIENPKVLLALLEGVRERTQHSGPSEIKRITNFVSPQNRRRFQNAFNRLMRDTAQIRATSHLARPARGSSRHGGGGGRNC